MQWGCKWGWIHITYTPGWKSQMRNLCEIGFEVYDSRVMLHLCSYLGLNLGWKHVLLRPGKSTLLVRDQIKGESQSRIQN